MANQGLNSGVIIPLGKIGVRITPALSHLTVQALIGQKCFSSDKRTVDWIQQQLHTERLIIKTKISLKVRDCTENTGGWSGGSEKRGR